MRKISLAARIFQELYRPNQWLVTASRGITVKIPPLFDGPTSWLKYDELIDDWLDLTQLEAGKREPPLKNRFVGDAGMYK